MLFSNSPAPQELLHLFLKALHSTGVFQHCISAGFFFVQWHLSVLACFHLLWSPAPLPGQPPEAQLPGSIDKENAVAVLAPTGLDHHCRVDQDQVHVLVRPGRGNLFGKPALDVRVNERLQFFSFRSIGKDNRAQSRAVNFPLSVEHPAAPALGHLLLDLGLIERLVAKRVAGDHPCAVSGKRSRHPTLAAADSSNKADHDCHDSLLAYFPAAICNLESATCNSSTSNQFGPTARSTLSGTSSFSFFSNGVVISSATRAATASTSSGGASNTNSSCIWSSMRLWRFSSWSRRWILSIASLIRSAAEPWISMLMASRSGWLRCW